MKEQASIIARLMTVAEAQVMLALPCLSKDDEHTSFLRKYRDNKLSHCVETDSNFRGGHLRITPTKLGEAVIADLRERLQPNQTKPKRRHKRRRVHSVRPT